MYSPVSLRQEEEIREQREGQALVEGAEKAGGIFNRHLFFTAPNNPTLLPTYLPTRRYGTYIHVCRGYIHGNTCICRRVTD